ncbi:hypothetical protein SAMN05216378_2687 [Paenibacillus catalpae]|uniref:Uncharacterized protein n=1 Tax=Paenibacillus catalpae TaxID=1045775 RepID=A0A1I1YKK6_9BACL|nr:hypothetical protein SAMN05216378_2687 [Paenibacillus catalpae]
MESILWIQNKYSSLISFIERNRERIPLSSFILIYLRIPILIRIFITALFFVFSHGLAYIIGFIILQSKARNEILSLISAFQNPIDFSNRLYFYYAFVYLFITILTILPLGIYLFYGRKLLHRSRNRKFIIIGSIVGIIFGLIIFWGLLQFFIPLLPYYLFYASKNSSLWEVLINYFAFSKELPFLDSSLDFNTFQQEVFISLQSGNIVVLLLIFIFSLFRDYARTREKLLRNTLVSSKLESHLYYYLNLNWSILKINILILHLKIKNIFLTLWQVLFVYIFIVAVLIVFVSHTAYQLGSFGKNLSQFDTDYISVEYNLNGQIKKVEGIRVYQDKNYIIVRDQLNNIHNVFTDQLHIQTKLLQSN